MQINAGEISSIIKRQIEDLNLKTEVEEIGEVIRVGDGIVTIFGLEKVVLGELLEFPGGVKGLALNLEEDNVGAVLFSGETSVRQGDIVKRTNMVAEVPVGKGLLGRIVNPLGEPLDGKGPVEAEKLSPIERKATGILSRKSVDTPLETGIKAIDGLIPIGRGQRELIIGDKKTGKTAICVDAIINQKGKNVFCIYVAIGQKSSAVANIAARLEEEGAMEYTIIVASTSDDMAPLQFLAPYSGAAMGEYFRDNGMHALIVYDDLTKQAWAYRQMSLLLKRPPGREAYPGDIFYLHSRLLERAAKLSDELGGGSLTALPVIETQAGDISAFIPTNVISITDGQLFLEANLFNAGVRPAIDVGYSVSRVGGAAQKKIMKNVIGSLKLYLAQYREVESFAKFGSDLDKATQQQLKRGERLIEILKQPQFTPLSGEEQVIVFYAAVSGFLDSVEVTDVTKYEAELLDTMRLSHRNIIEEIGSSDKLSDELRKKLDEVIAPFTEVFVEKMEVKKEPLIKLSGKAAAKGMKTEKKMPNLKNMNLDEKREVKEEEEEHKI